MKQAVSKAWRLVVPLAAGLLLVSPVSAQFGGREGEAVIFMLTSKGKGGLTITSPSAPNAQALVTRFAVIDPNKLPYNPADQPGAFFPQYRLKVLHDEPDDKMQVLSNLEGPATLHHLYLTTFKLFTFKGVRREYGDAGEPVMDVPPNVFASFYAGQDIGPNEALEAEQALVWTSKPLFPPFIPTPRGLHGPLNGPKVSGTQLLLDSATFPIEVPWAPMYKKYPGAGWKNGFDIKFLEQDTTAGNVAQMVRVHVGVNTQTFKVDGATHLFIVQGDVRLNLPGGTSTPLPTFQYAFIPSGMSFSISNPRKYDGPSPK